MSDSIQSSISDIHVAYRLMLQAKIIEARKRGDTKTEKAAQSELQKDDVTISAAGMSAQADSTSATDDDLDVHVKLSDLIKQLKNVETECPSVEDTEESTQTRQTQIISYQQTVETSASLTYTSLEKVDGLVVRNKNLAETDRYRFEFSDGTTFKITDKWSGRSTTIWGDPHVDTDDEEGSNDGDFQDLTSSNEYTTFMLADGTRLTFTAQDNGVIEAVDIYKGSQHLTGIGSASDQWTDETGLFASRVKNDASQSSSLVPTGDTVYAGGDGNDWYDASRRLVWGKTTGPVVTSRPSSVVQFQYYQRITQQLSVTTVNEQA